MLEMLLCYWKSLKQFELTYMTMTSGWASVPQVSHMLHLGFNIMSVCRTKKYKMVVVHWKQGFASCD